MDVRTEDDYVQAHMEFLAKLEPKGRSISSITMGGDGGFMMAYWYKPSAKRITRVTFTNYDGPALPPWISADLLAETRTVWTLRYQRLVSTEEALDMLNRVRDMAGAIRKLA